MNTEPVRRNVTQYNSTTNLTALNLTDKDFEDDSVFPLIKHFPSSYTLKTPNDFKVVSRNYTDDWLFGQISKKRDPLAPGFNMYQFFDTDLFNMRSGPDA